jgi:hypothetical protein
VTDDGATIDRGARHDPLTIISIAVAVYAVASLIHEGGGHGMACVLTGGQPHEMSSMHFDCLRTSGARWPRQVLAAAGTLVQVAVGLASAAWYRALVSRAHAPGAAAGTYAAWLFAAVNLMQGLGYFLFSGVGGIGDWAVFFTDVHHAALWRVPLAVVGFALYWLATARLFRALVPFLGGSLGNRLRHARRLALVPYLAGGALGILTGVRNPAGFGLLVISGVAATLGGTSGLAWGSQTLRGVPVSEPEGPSFVVRRSWAAVVAGVVAGVLFVWLLGPGIRFR